MKSISGLPLRAATLVLLAALAPAQGNLELGKMWTFENPPLAYLKDEYGFEPSAEWLDALRLASLRFGNGCSASFVSPKGLIMTNHHCVRGQIAQVSPPDADWVKNGFYSTRLTDEVKVPGLTVQQLVSMRDVTEAMNEGIGDGDDEAKIAAQQALNQESILAKAKADHGDLTPQIVKLHQGAVFQLYLYKVYDDVRLVCAPHLQTAHFGGDFDNFTYPRYSIDFSFCRAYENDQPADTSKHYFRWSTTGPIENELVFVTGNPGSTDRLKTVAQMEFMRDTSYPIVRQLIDNRLAIMRELASTSPELEQQLRTNILMFENAQKAYRGYHGGLLDEELMARKKAAEAEFKRRVQADESLRAQFGDAWSRLEEVAALKSSFEARRRFHNTAGNKPLARAVSVVRAVLSDGEAREKHTEAAVAMTTEMNPFERASFVDHLTRAGDWLRSDDPFLQSLLGDDHTPEQAAAALDKSAVGDTVFVKQLIAGGEDSVRASEDIAIQAALALEPLLRANAKLGDWITEQEDAQGVRIGRALFACYGNKVSPDATFTLRFSDGRVAGFPFNGTLAPFRTAFYGLYARHAEFDGEYPFDLPQVWIDRKDKVDMTKAVNFVSSNDIIGGNSGSPIVNRSLEVVGLIFDGNIEMLPNRFVYTDAVPRAVSVHVDAIMESLLKVYDAERIANELVGR